MSEQTSDKITPRSEDYSQWYLDVIRHADLAEAAQVVKGCMVIKPNGYAIWEKLQRALDDRFKATGHRNAYFPLLIPESFLKREAEHVEGFAPEVAMVTHAGGKKLEEPYAIRPTSETIIGHFFAKWIQSWRDLPLLINQWANVMRWEMRTRLFLRTSEFLWQEGHTAHADHDEAKEEVMRMLDVYADVAENLMAMPVIKGRKSDAERFAGALETFSIEAIMQDGRALQAGTSHDLGQNFGKAFDVQFQTQDGQLDYVWQTSWGLSTRMIGGLIMTHSDDAGLVLPPAMAPLQAVVVPVYRKAHEQEKVVTAARTLAEELRAAGITVHLDDRDWVRPGAKYYEWERQGVCYRVELGPRDLDKEQVVLKGRIAESKEFVPRAGVAELLTARLEEMQQALYDRARAFRDANTVELDTWEQFEDVFAEGSKFAWANHCGVTACEETIQEQTKVTIRNIPLEGGEAPDGGQCIRCGEPAAFRAVFAKAY